MDESWEELVTKIVHCGHYLYTHWQHHGICWGRLQAPFILLTGIWRTLKRGLLFGVHLRSEPSPAGGLVSLSVLLRRQTLVHMRGKPRYIRLREDGWLSKHPSCCGLKTEQLCLNTENADAFLFCLSLAAAGTPSRDWVSWPSPLFPHVAAAKVCSGEGR